LLTSNFRRTSFSKKLDELLKTGTGIAEIMDLEQNGIFGGIWISEEASISKLSPHPLSQNRLLSYDVDQSIKLVCKFK
jgi:hypothetical protein